MPRKLSKDEQQTEWLIRIGCVFLGFGLRKVMQLLSSLQYNQSQPPRKQLHGSFHLSEEYKMVLVVNDELKMGKGKVAAQCAHAAVGMIDQLTQSNQQTLLKKWESMGQPKICLRAQSSVHLVALSRNARSLGLPCFIVQDAGRTQVAAGSRTVMAIGPAPKSKIDVVTGGLKLL